MEPCCKPLQTIPKHSTYKPLNPNPSTVVLRASPAFLKLSTALVAKDNSRAWLYTLQDMFQGVVFTLKNTVESLEFRVLRTPGYQHTLDLVVQYPKGTKGSP